MSLSFFYAVFTSDCYWILCAAFTIKRMNDIAKAFDSMEHEFYEKKVRKIEHESKKIIIVECGCGYGCGDGSRMYIARRKQ